MINAQEALTLSTSDDIKVSELLDTIDNKIRAAAKAGKRVFVVDEPGWTDAHSQYWTPCDISRKILLAIDNIRALGFTAEYKPTSGYYVPVELQNNFDIHAGSRWRNYAIVINW